MTIRNATTALAVVSLLFAACGGGGTSDGVVLDDLNAPEKGLVGTYTLQDFHIWEAGTAPRDPQDFDAWSGTMELRADRTAVLRLELCEQAGEVSAACDREFAWTADSGMIRFDSLDAAEHDVCVQWEREGMGSMTTQSLLPTNDPDTGLFLCGEGYETLHWVRVE